MAEMAGIITPKQLLDELFITEPDEIDLEAIAAHLGASVKYAALTGCEARIVGDGDTAIITVNSQSLPQRQRFSIGHEIGHWVYDKGKISLECGAAKQQSFYTAQDPESRANAFASELLIPKPMLLPRLQGRKADLSTLTELADIFRTSMTSTACRVLDMQTHPTMVVCHTRAKRLWYRSSREVQDVLRPLRNLSKDSVAWGLLQGNGTSGSEEVDADAWIDHPDAGDYTVFESSFLATPEMVVSLLWWRSDLQIREAMTSSGDDWS